MTKCKMVLLLLKFNTCYHRRLIVCISTLTFLFLFFFKAFYTIARDILNNLCSKTVGSVDIPKRNKKKMLLFFLLMLNLFFILIIFFGRLTAAAEEPVNR